MHFLMFLAFLSISFLLLNFMFEVKIEEILD